MSGLRRLGGGTLFPLLGLGLAVILAVAGWLVLRRTQTATSGQEIGPLPAAPLAADKSLGVSTDLGRYDAAGREAALAGMEATGLSWVRLRFPWEAIEPERGEWNWAAADEMMEGAARHHLKVIAVLDGAPVWARAPEDLARARALPKENRDFGTFVAAFAVHYADRVDHYQVWDEPNIEARAGEGPIEPEAYAGLLREAAIQIRAADPDATVLLAALAPTTETGPANLSDLGYLDSLYRLGAAEWFDVVAAQPYCFDQPLNAPPEPGQLNWNRVALLRDVMLDHADGATAVWAVSAGCLQPNGVTGGADLPGAIAQAIPAARQNWPWLGPILWASWAREDRHGQYAVVGGDSSAAAAALESLATAPPIAYPGAYRADHAAASYAGSWRVTPSGADIGASGDRMTIAFWGTRIDLLIRRGPFQAFLYVTVDGKRANALPRATDGRAYVVLYDLVQNDVGVTLSRGLAAGEHTAEIVADRGWGQWAVRGWVVSQEAAYPFVWLPAVLFVAAAGMGCAGLAGLWPKRRALADRLGALIVRCESVHPALAFAVLAAAAAAVYVAPGAALSLCALVVLGALLVLRPEVGLALIAFLLPTRSAGKLLLGKAFSAAEILTLLTAAAWVLNWLLLRWLAERNPARTGAPGIEGSSRDSRIAVAREQRRLSPLDRGVLALVVVGAASLLWAEHLRVALREYRTVIFEGSLYYALLRLWARRRQSVWLVVDAWVLGATILAALGLLSWLFGFNLITTEGVRRVGGFGGSPNNVALYLGRVLPLAIVVGVCGQPGRRRWAYLGGAVAMAAATVLTYSRGAWLLGIPAALLFLAALRGRRRLVLAVSAVLLVAAGAVVFAGPERLKSLLDTQEGTSFVRVQLWQSSWAMIRDHPILGVGLDNFLYAYRAHYVLPTAWEEFNLSHPHNLLLDFWLRLGLPGVGVLLWLVIAFFRRGSQAYRQLRGAPSELLILGLMASVVYFIAHGLVDNAFFLVDLGFALMLALALVQWRPTDAPKPAPEGGG